MFANIEAADVSKFHFNLSNKPVRETLAASEFHFVEEFKKIYLILNHIHKIFQNTI